MTSSLGDQSEIYNNCQATCNAQLQHSSGHTQQKQSTITAPSATVFSYVRNVGI